MYAQASSRSNGVVSCFQHRCANNGGGAQINRKFTMYVHCKNDQIRDTTTQGLLPSTYWTKKSPYGDFLVVSYFAAAQSAMNFLFHSTIVGSSSGIALTRVAISG